MRWMYRKRERGKNSWKFSKFTVDERRVCVCKCEWVWDCLRLHCHRKLTYPQWKLNKTVQRSLHIGNLSENRLLFNLTEIALFSLKGIISIMERKLHCHSHSHCFQTVRITYGPIINEWKHNQFMGWKCVSLVFFFLSSACSLFQSIWALFRSNLPSTTKKAERNEKKKNLCEWNAAYA